MLTALPDSLLSKISLQYCKTRDIIHISRVNVDLHNRSAALFQESSSTIIKRFWRWCVKNASNRRLVECFKECKLLSAEDVMGSIG
jgi:hypothetical protein